MWISDQIILLSSDTPCQSLLEAQKLHKKLEVIFHHRCFSWFYDVYDFLNTWFSILSIIVFKFNVNLFLNQNLEVTLEYHQKKVENLSKEVLVLVAEDECIVDITRTCQTMEEEWNKLLGIFYDKKTKTNFTLKAQMVRYLSNTYF